MQETRVQSLGREDPLEKGMATHSSILAWRIPRTEEPSGLWDSKESDTTEQLTWGLPSGSAEKAMATHSSTLAWRISGTAEPGGLLSMGVTQSRTRLK